MTRKMDWLASRVPWLLGGCLAFGLTGLGQTEEIQGDERFERIEVTGSRIKRMDVEGSTPVTVITRDEIDQTGVTSVADLLRQTTSSPLGNFAGAGGYVRSGAATVNLLGIGANRTLVLLDGKRLPVDVSVGAVNVNNIPLSIVDRIEIVSGGQSAIYGADAVGGVVNIITRKDFTGSEVSLFANIPEHGGGEIKEITALGAAKFNDNLNVTITLGYKTVNEILRRNRKLINGVPPRDYTATNPPVGEYSWRPVSPSFGNWNPSPNCPAENQKVTVPEEEEDMYCAGPRDDTRSWMFPRATEWYATARADWNLSPYTKVSALALFSEYASEHNIGNYLTSVSDPFNNFGILVSRDRAEELGITGIPEDASIIELYARDWDFEDRWNNNTDRTYGGSLQFETIAGDWDLGSSVSFYRTTNRRDFLNVINKRRQVDLLHRNPDDSMLINPSYIPFDPNRPLGLSNTIHDDLVSKEVGDSLYIDVVGSRELFELPGGPLAIAIGANFQTEYYKQIPSELDLQQYVNAKGVATAPLYEGTASTSGTGSRNVYSVFTEVMAPIVPGFEIDAALRYDEYSDFGGTLNYSIGSIWKTTNYLAFRANSSSSFKAPQLDMVHAESGGGYHGIVDDLYCQRERERGNICQPGSGQQLYVDRPGNPNIKEEVGRSYNIGFVFEPTQNFNLIADYHGIFVKDRHGIDRVQQIADDFYEGKYVDIDANTSMVGPNIVNWEADPSEVEGQRVITGIKTPWANMGAIEVYAVDAKANVKFQLGGYNLAHSASIFRLLSYKSQNYQDMPMRQTFGYKGVPKWRMRNDLSFALNSSQLFNIGVQTIAKQQQDPLYVSPGRPYHDIDQYSEWDLSYRWRHKWNGELLLGVNNIFDTIGGRDSSGSVLGSESVSTSMYSVRGRSFFAKLTQRF